MKVSNAFDYFDHEISPGWYQQVKAEDRLARFTAVLTMLHSEIRVVPSGSWARGTAIDPIHDVDLILVLPDDLRPRYDAGSRSAEAVLEYVAGLVVESAELNNVHRVEPRNHVVKCYLDSTIATDDADWHGFAVEIMPAFQDGDGLRVPERRDDRWSTAARPRQGGHLSRGGLGHQPSAARWAATEPCTSWRATKSHEP